MNFDEIGAGAEQAGTAQELADQAWNHLAMHPDAVQRYQAIDLLTADLTRLRAITAKQLELEHGGLSAAANALGVTRQAVTDLYARADVPGPRADKGRADRPAYQYGRWLRQIRRIAEAANRGRQRDKLMTNATRTTRLYPALMRNVEEWLNVIGRTDVQRAARLRASLLPADAAVEALGMRHLSMAEQGDAVLGMHHQDDPVDTMPPLSEHTHRAIARLVNATIERQYGRGDAYNPARRAAQAALETDLRDHHVAANGDGRGLATYADSVLRTLTAEGLTARTCQCRQLHPHGCPHGSATGSLWCARHYEADVPALAGALLCGTCHVVEYETGTGPA